MCTLGSVWNWMLECLNFEVAYFVIECFGYNINDPPFAKAPLLLADCCN